MTQVPLAARPQPRRHSVHASPAPHLAQPDTGGSVYSSSSTQAARAAPGGRQGWRQQGEGRRRRASAGGAPPPLRRRRSAYEPTRDPDHDSEAHLRAGGRRRRAPRACGVAACGGWCAWGFAGVLLRLWLVWQRSGRRTEGVRGPTAHYMLAKRTRGGHPGTGGPNAVWQRPLARGSASEGASGAAAVATVPSPLIPLPSARRRLGPVEVAATSTNAARHSRRARPPALPVTCTGCTAAAPARARPRHGSHMQRRRRRRRRRRWAGAAVACHFWQTAGNDKMGLVLEGSSVSAEAASRAA